MKQIKTFEDWNSVLHINEDTQYTKQSQIYDLFSNYIDEFGVDSSDKIIEQLQYISRKYRNSNHPYKSTDQVAKPDISKSWVNGN